MASENVLVAAGITMIIVALVNPKTLLEFSGTKFDLPILPWYTRLILGLFGVAMLVVAGYSNEELKILLHLPQPEKTLQKQTTYQIDVASSWQDTGINLSSGQEFRITASGIVIENNKRISPQGDDLIETEIDAPRPGLAHLVIVGKVNNDGTVFLVGKEYDGFAEKEGHLFLAINEGPTNLFDNTGSFIVTVEH